ncbi:hypothetical protein NK6_1844 [Bradyrhizobium diazoefficiens]|uniref:Uncharacterized protein n=1 Tax=Bradyrhizobium diazoefficiens TaxID=1355477 RepID=A0A0E4FRJ4_9BRAD|nr:hypothetical protein NK6_1844 [Bradyrhizobium diazoefficiens]
MATRTVSSALHLAQSKVRRSKPGLSGSMQTNLIGVRHVEQRRILKSETPKLGLD